MVTLCLPCIVEKMQCWLQLPIRYQIKFPYWGQGHCATADIFLIIQSPTNVVIHSTSNQRNTIGTRPQTCTPEYPSVQHHNYTRPRCIFMHLSPAEAARTNVLSTRRQQGSRRGGPGPAIRRWRLVLLREGEIVSSRAATYDGEDAAAGLLPDLCADG